MTKEKKLPVGAWLYAIESKHEDGYFDYWIQFYGLTAYGIGPFIRTKWDRWNLELVSLNDPFINEDGGDPNFGYPYGDIVLPDQLYHIAVSTYRSTIEDRIAKLQPYTKLLVNYFDKQPNQYVNFAIGDQVKYRRTGHRPYKSGVYTVVDIKIKKKLRCTCKEQFDGHFVPGPGTKVPVKRNRDQPCERYLHTKTLVLSDTNNHISEVNGAYMSLDIGEMDVDYRIADSLDFSNQN